MTRYGRYGARTTKRTLPRFDPAPSARFAARALKATKARGALIGRLAIWAWLEDESQHEFTKDLDVAVPRTETPIIKAWLDQQSLRTRNLPLGGVNVYYPEQGINVDFIDRTGNLGDLGQLYTEAVNDAVDEEYVVEVEGGTRLFLVAPDYLVVMKVAADEEKDRRDVVRILRAIDFDDEELEFIRALITRYLEPRFLAKFEALLESAFAGE